MALNFTPICVLWQISHGGKLRLKLLYYDHLLQRNVTGFAACAIPKTSDQLPFVICRKNIITVDLPFRTRLIRIKTVRNDIVAGILFSKPGARFVKILTRGDEVRMSFSFFSFLKDGMLIYSYFTGISF